MGGGTGRIVFSSYREGESEIFTMDSDGSDVTRLTEDSARVNRPACSLDGKHIAYVRREWSTNLEIYVMNADGSDPFRLTYNLKDNDIEPDWSPDGSSIAFSSSEVSDFDIFTIDLQNFDIYTINLENFQQTRLTENPGVDRSPDWSPDGNRIVFSSQRDGNTEIFVMNADGSGERNLTNHPANDTHPAWSPNGDLIAFVSDRYGDDNIYVMSDDASKPIRLTDSAGQDTNPAWSPDGELITFQSNRSGNSEIYVMNADGTNQTPITHHEEFDGFPDWQPPVSSLETIAIHAPYTIDPEITEWLKQNAFKVLDSPFVPNEPQYFFDDARIVLLGTTSFSSHETHDFIAGTTGGLQFTGFKDWVISMDWGEAEILNEFIYGDINDPRDMLIGLDNWVWSTAEMRGNLRTLRVNNRGLMVSIYGIYNLPPNLSMDRVVEFLQSVDPNAGQVAGSRYECFRKFESDWHMYTDLAVEEKDQCAKDLQQVVDDLKGHQEEYKEASSLDEVTFALLSAEFVVHLEEQYRIEDPELQNQLRTRNTAEGIRWLLERSGSNAKMVLWASSHMIADLGHEATSGTPLSVGSYLKDFYGEEMITIGVTFYSGKVNARSYDSGNPVIVHQVHPPPSNSFEWIAHHVGMPTFILDLREIDLDDPGAAWLDQPLYLHCIGEYYDPTSPEDYLCEYHLPTAFDAIVYIDQVTPTQFLPGARSD
jgi:Tol biopolymer transport system component/erythromycin esterase-like protein